MDSSVSPTHGAQEGTAWNGHFDCSCYHPLFVFNQFGHLERCKLRPGNVHSADGWEDVLKPVMARYADKDILRLFRADAAFAIPALYETLEAAGYFYAIRLPTNVILQDKIADLSETSGRPAAEPRAPGLWRLRVSGRLLGQAPPGAGQGRVASRRAVSARRLPRHQPALRSLSRSSPSTISAAPPSSTSRRARSL